MTIKVGTKLTSTVCSTQVMVLRCPPGVALDVSCGGQAMSLDPLIGQSGEPPAGSEGTIAGKRYNDPAETIEFLCTRGGSGGLAVNGEPMVVKQAKQLPSSD